MDSWVTTAFTEVLDIQGGTQPPKSQFIDHPQEGYVRLLQIRDFGLKPVPTYIPDTSKLKKIEDRDILIGRYGASLGRICSGKTGAYNVALAKVLSTDDILNSYLKRYLESQIFQAPLALLSRSAQNGFNKDDLANFDFPLPPLAEQKVIAQTLDTLLAQVERSKARLDRIPSILKRFRQSVLAAAVSGKLTEDWRDSNGIKPVSESWEFSTAKEICEKVQSGSTPRNSPFDKNGNVPFLKVYNIVDQAIDFSYKPQFIEEATHTTGSSARSIALPDDVLMNIVGPPLGKVAILTDQYPEWNLNQAITLFRVKKEKLLHKYLYFFLCEGQLVRDVMHETKGIVGQVNISLSQCRNSVVAVPSVAEQTEIVSRVETLFAHADKIEQQVAAAQARVDQFTQSILAKAFRGELTAEWRAQNPELISGDNSAEALLAKIQAEREAAKPKKKTRARKTTKQVNK